MSLTPSTDVLVAHLAGEAVLLNLTDKSYYRLNETAALVWGALEAQKSRDEIIADLTGNYSVSQSDAEKEVDQLIVDLTERKLLITD